MAPAIGSASPERVNQRNGYRPRTLKTRVGEVELAISKLRQGSYFPSFLEPRKVSEQALVACVQEAYVNGVPTRKVDRLVEALGLAGISKEPGLAALPGARRARGSLPRAAARGLLPVLWLDAKVEKAARGRPRAAEGAPGRLRRHACSACPAR